MMEYKGYVAKVDFDDEANLFHGRVLYIRDVINFQGQSVEELRREFAESVEDYLEFCAERGEKPEKPFSGRFVVRVDPALHRNIAVAASRSDLSINAWVAKTLDEATQLELTHEVDATAPPLVIAQGIGVGTQFLEATLMNEASMKASLESFRKALAIQWDEASRVGKLNIPIVEAEFTTLRKPDEGRWQSTSSHIERVVTPTDFINSGFCKIRPESNTLGSSATSVDRRQTDAS